MVILLITNSKELKKINIQTVKGVLKDNDYCTKNSLAKDTGLSVATCGNILKELIFSGEVQEVEKSDSTGGRPSRRFSFNKNFSYVSILFPRVEGNKTTVSINVLNLMGEIIYKDIKKENEITPESLNVVFKEVISKYPKIKILSIGIPGVVKNGLISACDFKYLNNINLKDFFSAQYNIETIVENDVNACAAGYLKERLTNKIESFVYIYFPVSGIPGSGIIINNQIIRGKSNFAGEISYLPLLTERKFQGEIQQNKDLFEKYISNIIQSINCIVNPQKIVLSGFCLSQQIVNNVNFIMEKKITKKNIPQLIFEKDIEQSYFSGLKYLAFEKYFKNITIIRK